MLSINIEISLHFARIELIILWVLAGEVVVVRQHKFASSCWRSTKKHLKHSLNSLCVRRKQAYNGISVFIVIIFRI